MGAICAFKFVRMPVNHLTGILEVVLWSVGLGGLMLLVAVRIADWKDKVKWHSTFRVNMTLLLGFGLALVLILAEWLSSRE
jgi:hypothetical protein